MKTKNHHMILRGNRWQFKIRIPSDVQEHYRGRSSKFIEETLRTGDVQAARKLRDAKLKNYQRLWDEMRLRKEGGLRGGAGVGVPLAGGGDYPDPREMQPQEISDHISVLGDEIDKLAHRLAPSDNQELDEARDEVMRSGEGAALWRQIQILRGSLTPLEPLFWEWMDSKRGKSDKAKTEYRRAMQVLLERFTYKEDLTHRKAQKFLLDTLEKKAQATVGKYLIVYRGMWRFHGWGAEEGMWSIGGLDSAVAKTRVRGVTDEDYLRIMDAIRGTKQRRLWLAIRIAAYSGAARSGVCGVRLEGAETDKPTLYLPETKKDWRTRRVPCHPEILADVEEWSRSPLAPTTVTNEFTAVKVALGYGRELVFHSFRHSVTNKLENARVSSREIKRLLGHRIGNITFDTYNAEGLGYDVLNEVVREISWPRVEW